MDYQWLIGTGLTVIFFIIGYVGAHLGREKKSKEKLHTRIDDVEERVKMNTNRINEHLIRHEERDRDRKNQ